MAKTVCRTFASAVDIANEIITQGLPLHAQRMGLSVVQTLACRNACWCLSQGLMLEHAFVFAFAICYLSVV
jgi:hypothetical protein